jgi:hypothetical protein
MLKQYNETEAQSRLQAPRLKQVFSRSRLIRMRGRS